MGLALFFLREMTDARVSITNESNLYPPNFAIEWAAFLLHIREILRTYLGPEAGIFRVFLQPL